MRWRDVYDHGDLDMPGRGIGNWCTMANQTNPPQQPNAYFRHLAGWIDTIDITNMLPGTTLQHESNSHSAFVYRRNAQEAYFIEARRREGIRNQTLPGSGLAIWHTMVGGRNSISSYEFPSVALMQADGRNDLENRINRGDFTDLFRLGLRTKFNSSTTPAAIYHDGTPSGLSISRISDTGAVMTFKIGDEDYDDEMHPKYKFLNQIMAYARANENVEIVVDQNFTLDFLISIPAPRTPGITLTVRSANPAAPVTITRGASGNFFAIPDGASLIFRDIIIDGGGNNKFDDGDDGCEEVYEDGQLISGGDCDDDNGGGGFTDGGGGTLVRINSGGTFTMNAGAVVRNNINAGNAGGVDVRGGGIFTMNGGEISGNTSNTASGGGVYITNNGLFTMNGGKISGNSAVNGGGVRASTGGTFSMIGGEISGNTSTTGGGGMFVGGTFSMSGGEIKSNTSGSGGGVRVSGAAAIFTMINGKIINNTATNNGGGVNASNTFTMEDGEISGNTASGTGGGVHTAGAASVFTMLAGKISDNTAGTNGGGLLVEGTSTMAGGEISGNSAAALGGGVRVTGTSAAFIMVDGKITDNTSGTDGGGVNLASGTLTVTGGEISENIAVRNGGGVHKSGGEFILGGTIVINHNTATDGDIISNVNLPNNQYVSISSTTEPAAGMTVGIMKAIANNNGVFVQSGAAAGHTQYFYDDNTAARTITHYDGMLVIGTCFYHRVAAYGSAGSNLIVEVEHDIELYRLVSVPAPTTADITLTIRSTNPNASVSLTRGTTGNLFTVGDGRTLIFENVIIDGDGGENGNFADNGGGHLVRVNDGGMLVMNDGALLRNSVNSGGTGGVNVIAGGAFIMNGGKISGNTNNSTGNPGGGVRVNGTFTMNGGEISGNTVAAGQTGGGVNVSEGAFTMNGGKISGNRAASGSGVHVPNNAIFIMNGGEISGNTNNSTRIAASGVSVAAGGTVSINGGVIVGAGANIAAIVNGPYSLNQGDGSDPNNAVIIAWNKPAGDGPFNYTAGTATDLTTLPANATVWAINDDVLGILYTHGTNTGFIPINSIYGGTFIRHRPQQTDTRFGILLERAIVSDLARISVITPEPAMVNLRILDNLGNVVFSANGVGAYCIRPAIPNERTTINNIGDLGVCNTPLQNAIVWNLTNNNGRFVANGTYLIIAEAIGISGRRYLYSTRIGVQR